MITKINTPCVNCGASTPADFREYDGMLGYEAVVCRKCGYVYDDEGAYSPEEWYGLPAMELALNGR